MDKPIVICGLGRVGSRVLEYLRDTDLKVVVIDTQCQADDPRLCGIKIVRGDCRRREVLEEAGVANARGVLVLTGDDLINIAATLMVRALNPEVRVVLRMFNQNLIGRLGKAVTNVYALSTSLLTAPILAMTALTGQGLGRFRLGDDPSEERRQVAEVPVPCGSPLDGLPAGELARTRGVQVLAHLPADGPATYLLDVSPDTRLEEGDHVVVCGPPRAVNALLAASGADQDDLRWAGWPRRLARVVGSSWKQIDLPVKICTGVLLGVMIASTVFLHLSVEKYNRIPDALFRTISIMATGSDMHEADFRQSAGVKVFVSALRIVGAALMAAFTAIVTNYLLRARLAGALEVRRIPEEGHVIICGLAPVGFRVLEELLDCKCPVVVIEKDPDNRFVATARRKGVPVIIGDITVPEVLRQAHAATARAVIAATNHDLINLEVTLLVRELNPTQRVVVLQADPLLAQMLREAANVRLAVSVPALAAPAFVVGLFGDQVLSVFLVGGQLLAAIDLVVKEGDAFLNGQPVRAVAVDYRILPVAVLPPPGTAPASQPLTARLQPGNRLVGIIALPDLERLLRRQPLKTQYAVDVTGFPIPARGWLAGLLRSTHKVSAQEAETLLDRLPLRLESNLTRGQAEDLLARLQRERVTAQLRQLEPAAG
jgi:Trk K+ transport system NAD-binding subunit